MNQIDSATETPILTSDQAVATDAQLMERFVNQRDQAAFEQLLLRHGPMVFGVGHRILKRHHEAEDAFQATFLSLARDAAQIARPEMLASWLYKVAHHAALKVKKATIKRQQVEQQLEQQMDTMPNLKTDRHEVWPDLASVLDVEIERLSDDLRVTVVMCDIEGKTRNEAARELGWPLPTVSTRLTKARSLLAKRLTRHGIVLSGSALGLLLTQNAATAGVPGSLVASTLTAASAVSAAHTTTASVSLSKIVALIKGSYQSALLGKIVLAGIVTTALLSASLALKPTPEGAKAQAAIAKLASPLKEIANTYRANYSAIKSLRMEYQARHETLIDPEVLWKAWKFLALPSEQNLETLVIDGKKVQIKQWSKSKDRNTLFRLLREKQPDRFGPNSTLDVLSYKEILEHVPETPAEIHEAIRIYDGLVLRDNNQGLTLGDEDHIQRPNFVFKSPSQSDRPMFQHHNYLDLIFYGITAADLPLDHKFREQFRMPDLLVSGKWRVVSEREPIDGADCVMIESSESDQLWLDPKAGFALRRWIKERPYKVDIDYQDLRHLSGDIWIPHRLIETHYAESLVPSEYLGKPATKTHYELKLIELNQPIDQENFKMVPPEGAMVFDTTLKPLDASGKPMPGQTIDPNWSHAQYKQPADPADIPKVVKEAQMTLGKQTQGEASSKELATKIRWFVVANLLLVAGGYYIYRRRQAS